MSHSVDQPDVAAVKATDDSDEDSPEGSGDDENRDSGSTWRDDEYPSLELSHETLKHVASCYLPGAHGRCIDITLVGRGTFHEVRILHFENDWTCIGRFTRNKEENLAVIESECGTRAYVRKHTNIPVPETYFANFDPTNAVGAAFVLMEHIEDYHLYEMWPALKVEFKLAVISQLVEVIAQLANLTFDKIGSLELSGAVRLLQNLTVPRHQQGHGPFGTTEEYILSFLGHYGDRPAQLQAIYPDIQRTLQQYMQEHRENSVLHPPYRLIHGDVDAQNMMFDWESPTVAPKFLGVIDWDYTYTGTLYYLCEYPIFIQDCDLEQGAYIENNILHKNFVKLLAQKFPKGSVDRRNVRACFRQKNHTLNSFADLFTKHTWSDPAMELRLVEDYLKSFSEPDEEQQWLAYGGRYDWEPDSELDSDDDEL